ncbi:MAG: PAS domain-containing sensor histidine kinase [Candidatus Thorarchaeota archaeon]
MKDDNRDSSWLHRVMEVVRDGFVVIQDDDIVLTNSAFTDMLGYERNALLDTEFEDLVDRSSKNRDKELIEALVEGENPQRFITRLAAKDGNVLHVEITPTLISHDGEPAVIATVTNITSKMELEATVSELQNRFATLYDMSPVAYFTLNRKGTIEQVNEAAEELLGCEADHLIGQSLSEYLPDPEPLYDPGVDIVKEVLRGNPVTGLEIQMKRRDGRLIWVNISSRALVSEQQKPDEIGITAFDVTSRRSFEERLKVESERAKLYMEVMSSDLNMTKQNVLFAMEDLSISMDLPNRLKGVLSETSWSVRSAGRMIANMGVLISLDHNPPEKVLTRLQPHFNKAVREATRDFAWKTLKVNSNIQNQSLEVIGHAFLWYIFFNIIHYSASTDQLSEVEIDINAELTEDGDMVRLEFLDRAPAVPDELKDQIFRRTGVAEEHLAGKGLGLTVVDRYIEDLGGSVWVENRVKSDSTKGSKFVVLIPAWKEQLKIPKIVFYKSEHCVFCGPVYDSLTMILKELGIGPSVIEVQNVDSPKSDVQEDDLPALPTILLGKNRLSGFVADDDLRVAISTMLLTSG